MFVMVNILLIWLIWIIIWLRNVVNVLLISWLMMMIIIIWLMMVNSNYWLVVYLPTPLIHDGLRQLGWWHSQYMESHTIPWFQSPPTRSFDAWHCAAEVPKKQLPFNQDPNLFASNGTPNHWFPCTQRHGCIFSLQVCGRSPWKDDEFLDRTLHDSPRMVIPASYPLEHGRGNPDFQWEDHVKIFKMDIDGGLSIARSVLLRGSGLGSHGPTHHGCKPLAAISSRINDPRLLRGVSNGVNQKISKK